MSSHDLVQQLLDREQIRDLLARYPQAFDDRDWTAWEQLWTDDVVWIVDGTLSNGRMFVEGVGMTQAEADAKTAGLSEAEAHAVLHDAGSLDGMKIDERGNLWTSGPGGLWVFGPEGELLGRYPAPEVIGNLTWGGADLHTLFLMTTTTVHALRTLVGPTALPYHG
jgi:hypothetical protein